MNMRECFIPLRSEIFYNKCVISIWKLKVYFSRNKHALYCLGELDGFKRDICGLGQNFICFQRFFFFLKKRDTNKTKTKTQRIKAYETKEWHIRNKM